MMDRCEMFEQTLETEAQEKLKVINACVEDSRGGIVTKVVDIAGPTATVVFSLACGVAVTMSIATFGAASFAAALVAGTALVVKVVDKHVKKNNAKVIQASVNNSVEAEKIIQASSYFNCIVKDVARELSRIFEFQLFQLKDDKQVKIFAKCAVDLMLDLKKEDVFDRNTLIKKVLKEGKAKKVSLQTRRKGVKWSAPNVFRKPGLRRMIIGNHGAGFKYFVKANESCKTEKYGYRGQFLELEKWKEQRPVTNGIPYTDQTGKDSCKNNSCKECFSNHEDSSTNDRYFVESKIDAEYTTIQHEPSTYHAFHILIQCPTILDSFISQNPKPSLATFLKRMLGLPEYLVVRTVYRPHSLRKLSHLENSDLSRSDFSHCNLANISLKECNFSGFVMLSGSLEGANMSGSKLSQTFISHSSLVDVNAEQCEWTNMSLLHSRVDRAKLNCVVPSICGNCFDGTNISQAVTGKEK